MYIGPTGPLSHLEDLELQRDRLKELIALGLVSPTLSDQIHRAVAQIENQIAEHRQSKQQIKVAA